jgi:diguanylate cyclase (GGDEF)-like protein
VIRQSILSIRNVILGLGVLSILVCVGLAGAGWFGMQRQLEARQRLVLLEEALNNHNTADAFMDDLRNDVLRALAITLGTSREDTGFIRAELQHHIDAITSAILEDRDLPLTPHLHQEYIRLADMLPAFTSAGRTTAELALTDPVAGSVRYETFRTGFADLEKLMDDVRDILRAQLTLVRASATDTANLAKKTIQIAAWIGVILLILVTSIAVRIVNRITRELAASQEEAQHLALHDVLTGLPNRALLTRQLEQDLAFARRRDGRVALMCLDLDRFKQVNDTLGHPAGDALLRVVAQRLVDCVSGAGMIARLSGDEFAVVQTSASDIAESAALALRIIEALSQPYQLDGQQVVIGASVGIALSPDDTLDSGELLKMADMALYRAKNEGRGTYRLFEPEMDRKMQARRVLELDMRRALAAGEFELHYQPLIDMASSSVSALEALVRWRHPEKGLVPPMDFIPLAEETGLIAPLGAWVLKRACMDAASWPPHVRVAVNVSPIQFKGQDLILAVTEALMQSGLTPGRLELEITESALLTNAETTLAILRELRSAGIRIVMDDFGTGYSSLGYLRSFPFDKIKIDGGFVRDIETSRDCKAIVEAVTGLGLNLDIATTAEGVETIAQLELLRAAGCNQAQGFLFSRPVPAAEVAKLLARHWFAPASNPDVAAEASAYKVA